MKISRLTLANLTVGFLLMISPFMLQVTSSAPYDPWADLDEDGDIDIFDIVNMAGRYATIGDPGKNVTVAKRVSEVVTLASNFQLYEMDEWDSGIINIDGYSKVTVLVNIDTTSNTLIIFARADTDYLVETVSNFNRYWTQTYHVMAPNLRLLIYNTDARDVSLWVEIYLVA